MPIWTKAKELRKKYDLSTRQLLTFGILMLDNLDREQWEGLEAWLAQVRKDCSKERRVKQ